MATRFTTSRRNSVLLTVGPDAPIVKLVATVAVLMTATSLRAQEMRGFVDVALTAAPWTVNSVDGGSPSTEYTNTTTDSSVVGVGAEFGWRYTRRTSIGLELNIPERREVTRNYVYLVGEPGQTVGRYRAMTILGVVRRHLLVDRRAHLDLVGGFGFDRESALQRFAPSVPPTFDVLGPFGAQSAVARTTIAAEAGADFVLDTVRHLSVVPQFRVLVMPRGGPSGVDFANFGLSTIVYRFGVGLRLGF